jgi:hypothetical protein
MAEGTRQDPTLLTLYLSIMTAETVWLLDYIDRFSLREEYQIFICLNGVAEFLKPIFLFRQHKITKKSWYTFVSTLANALLYLMKVT